jgi:deoxyribose-phosphate aldolase
MIEAGANRLGASAGVSIVRELGSPEFTPRTRS